MVFEYNVVDQLVCSFFFVLESLVVNSGSGNVISLFVFEASLVSSACDSWK